MDARGKRKLKTLPRKNNNKQQWLTIEEKILIGKIDQWVKDAISREKNGQKVFLETNHAKITSKVCCISESQVYRLRESKVLKDVENENHVNQRKNKLDDFNKSALSRLVYNFYTKPNLEIPTHDKIHSAAFEIPRFPKTSRASVHRNLKKLGFVCKKRNKTMNFSSFLML